MSGKNRRKGVQGKKRSERTGDLQKGKKFKQPKRRRGGGVTRAFKLRKVGRMRGGS